MIIKKGGVITIQATDAAAVVILALKLTYYPALPWVVVATPVAVEMVCRAGANLAIWAIQRWGSADV